MIATDPLVISCSINGARKKEDNPFVPVGHAEIARTAIACLDAGASVIHAHNTDFTLTGREAAEDYLKSWRQVMAQRPGALWYPTLSAKFGSDLTHIEVLDDEIDLAFGCIDPGAVPFGRLDEQGLPVGFIYSTGFDEIRAAFAMFSRRRLGVQIAIYEPNFLRTTLAYHAAGKLPEGTVVNLYFGGLHGAGGGAQGMSFGLPPTRTALDAYLEMLGDADLPWTVSVWGGDIFESELPQLAIERGGHVQVGLESYFVPGRPVSNEEQVARVVALAKAAGRPVADHAATLRAWRVPTREAAARADA